MKEFREGDLFMTDAREICLVVRPTDDGRHGYWHVFVFSSDYERGMTAWTVRSSDRLLSNMR